MKTFITIVIAVISFFCVSNVSAQSAQGSKALDQILKMKAASNEDVTDKYKGKYRYDENGNVISSEFKKTTVKNHYWFASATAGYDSKSSGFETNLKLGRHMRGFNAYVSGGVRQISLEDNLDAKALATQAALGLQWEVVSTFVGHSRLQVAFGPEFGFHNLDYKPADGYRWYGFSPSYGGALNVDYKVSESFSIGAYAKYTTFKVNNEWMDMSTKEIHSSKVNYNTVSAGITLTWNINVHL